MEPVGLAIALTPVVDNSVKAARLYFNWKRIPSDLDRAVARLQKLFIEIEMLTLLDNEIPESHRRVIFDPTGLRGSMLRLLPKALVNRSKKNRLRWMACEKRTFERRLSDLAEDISRAKYPLLVQW